MVGLVKATIISKTTITLADLIMERRMVLVRWCFQTEIIMKAFGKMTNVSNTVNYTLLKEQPIVLGMKMEIPQVAFSNA